MKTHKIVSLTLALLLSATAFTAGTNAKHKKRKKSTATAQRSNTSTQVQNATVGDVIEIAIDSYTGDFPQFKYVVSNPETVFFDLNSQTNILAGHTNIFNTSSNSDGTKGGRITHSVTAIRPGTVTIKYTRKPEFQQCACEESFESSAIQVDLTSDDQVKFNNCLAACTKAENDQAQVDFKTITLKISPLK